MHRAAAVTLLALALTGCTPGARAPSPLAVREMTPGFLARVSAADPSLAADPAGRVALTWVSRDASDGDVFVSVSHDSGSHWTPPLRLNLTPGRVSSYTESRPVAAFGPRGQLVVAWAARRDTGEFADDIVARASEDGGLHFGPPLYVNDDASDPTSTYHGFVTVAALEDGAFMAAWIDGRTTAAEGEPGEPDAGEIWSALSRDGGRSWQPNARIADSVCACCRIELRSRGRDVALAYRGMRGNLRDPRIALSSDGGASFALDTLVSRDAWELDGCPSHGPSLALGPGGGLITWFTAGTGRTEGVYVADWRDDGRAGVPERLEAGLREPERPRLAGADDDVFVAALAVPLDDSTRRVWAVRRWREGAAPGEWTLLGAKARSGALAAAGPGTAWAAWTEDLGEGPRLRVARLSGR